MRFRYLLLTLLLPALLIAGVACGDDDDDEEQPTATTGAPDGAGEVVGVAAIDGIGDVLVDGDGFTLYIFTNDSDGTSTCVDSCAATWPPLVTTETEIEPPEGVDGMFTLFERSDGQMQVVYEGQPLYRYGPDSAPGDATGEGFGGVWFVALTDPDAAAVPEGDDNAGTNTDASTSNLEDGYYD